MARSSRRSLSRIRVWISSGIGISSGSPKSSGVAPMATPKEAREDQPEGVQESARRLARLPGSLRGDGQVRFFHCRGDCNNRVEITDVPGVVRLKGVRKSLLGLMLAQTILASRQPLKSKCSLRLKCSREAIFRRCLPRAVSFVVRDEIGRHAIARQNS